MSMVYRTQLEAVAYLRDAGYKVSKSSFNRDVAARKVARAEGGFDESALLAYASTYLTPLAQHKNEELSAATVDRLSADADLKKYTAERTRLKLEKERGALIEREKHEEDLAARAAFFRAEIESFGMRKAGEIIDLLNGDEGKTAAFLRWWTDATADWMDAWAADRQFTYDARGEDETVFEAQEETETD